MRSPFFVAIVFIWVAFGAIAAGTATVVDQAGREVVISQPVQRVVSLYGVATMYLYALGVQERLVLGTYVGLKPGSPSWAALMSVDPGLPDKYAHTRPSLEEVLAREPDLVLANPWKDPGVTEEFAAFGVPVVILHAEDVEGIRGATELLGRIFGVEERAAKLLSYLDAMVRAIASAVAGRGTARPRTLFVGTRPLRVASGEMYQTQLIELAGGDPVAAELRGYWQDVDIEQVLLWDPEVIFIAPYGRVTPEDLLNDPVWRGISAVRGKRVHKMPWVFSPWDIPTPESFLGLLWMAAKLHPDIGIDIVAEAEAFYREFYGYELPDDLIAVIEG
ncbi:MAG: ABC transporter substrate-binding protein [Caldiserica bacterium]|nr:ABC transporter substrate-binding protein [Caldisericota bacterium]